MSAYLGKQICFSCKRVSYSREPTVKDKLMISMEWNLVMFYDDIHTIISYDLLNISMKSLLFWCQFYHSIHNGIDLQFSKKYQSILKHP